VGWPSGVAEWGGQVGMASLGWPAGSGQLGVASWGWPAGTGCSLPFSLSVLIKATSFLSLFFINFYDFFSSNFFFKLSWGERKSEVASWGWPAGVGCSLPFS
jgi:hypothetical protein